MDIPTIVVILAIIIFILRSIINNDLINLFIIPPLLVILKILASN